MSTSRRSFLKRAAASAAALRSSCRRTSGRPRPSPTRGSRWASSAWASRRAACWAGSSGRTRRCWPSATWTPRAATTPRSGSTSSTPSSRTQAASCAAYNDFREIIARKDIDAVCIATPDHWHASSPWPRCAAGKDVYCEKPLTHNIHEAVEVMQGRRRQQARAADRLDAAVVEGIPRRLRTGAQRRHRQARARRVQLRRSGPCPATCRRSRWSRAWTGTSGSGPAPMRPYNSVLSPRGVHDHFPNWRDYREFGGGMVTDWGAHHLDIAQWGLGMDDSGPVEILPAGEAGRQARRQAGLCQRRRRSSTRTASASTSSAPRAKSRSTAASSPSSAAAR